MLRLLIAAAVLATFVAVPPSFAAMDADLAPIAAKTGEKREDLIQLRAEWGAVGESRTAAESYIARLKELALASPQDEELVRHYIQVATEQKAFFGLREAMDSYAEAHPDRPEAHYYLGMIDPTAGRPHFDKSLELDPDYYYGQVAVASHEMTQPGSDLAAAKQRLLDAAKSHPDRSLAFVVLDQFYRKVGDRESSRAAVERAAVADPWDGRVRGTLLQMLQAEGTQAQNDGTLQQWADEATSTLVKISRLADDGSLAFIAARIWGGVNQRDRVIEHLEIAADLGFPDPYALSMDRGLARILGDGPDVKAIQATMKKNREGQADQLREQVRTKLVREPVPAASFPILGGGNVDLASLKGKTVVLDFWATWCGPCRKALPTLQTFYESKPSDVEVYCVNVFERDGGKSVEGFWEQGGYPMPVALGSQADANNFGVRSIPTLVVVGPDGNIRYQHSGYSPYMGETLGFIAEILREETP